MAARSDSFPDREEFDRLARASLTGLPQLFQQQLADIVIATREFATDEQLASVGIDNRWNLTGLYEGCPIDQQSSWDSGNLPPVISLFRQPLLREWQETGVDFDALIRHVVIHEAGHHFGFSDEDMHALEDSVDQ